MEINTIIEVQAFGDFDVIHTVCIMVHSDKIDKNEIMEEFYQIEGIPSNTGLEGRCLYDITQNFIAFLELKGFKKLKTQTVYFCDC